MPTRRDFLQARNKGEKALARGLVIQAISRDTDSWRVGLTASKKIGNAVCRNRARRRMRALARQHLKDMILGSEHKIECSISNHVSKFTPLLGSATALQMQEKRQSEKRIACTWTTFA